MLPLVARKVTATTSVATSGDDRRRTGDVQGRKYTERSQNGQPHNPGLSIYLIGEAHRAAVAATG